MNVSITKSQDAAQNALRHRARAVLWSLAAVFAIAAGTASAQLPDRIKIAQLVSLTGGNAPNNAVVVAGVKMAVAEINRAGGIAGKPVDLVMGDDQSDPTQSVNTARRLVQQEKVHFVIGPFASQYTLATAPIFNESKTASISTSGSTALTPKIANYHFSIIPPADVQGRTMVVYAQDVLKAKSIGWISDNGAQSKSAFEEGVKQEAERRKMQVTGVQEFQFRANDVTPQLLSLRRTNPDVLLMWPGTGEDHGLILKNLNDIGWKVKVVNGGATSLHIATAKAVYADSFVDVPSTMLRNWTYCPGDPVGSGELPRFAERLKAAEPENYAKLSPSFAAWAYDAVFLAKAAIEGSRSVDGPVLTRWIEQNARSFKGVSGPIAATPTNHFLASSPDSIVMAIDTDKPRADGLYRRASGC